MGEECEVLEFGCCCFWNVGNFWCFILFDIFLFYGRRFLYISRYRSFFMSIMGEAILSGLYIAVKNRRILSIGFLGKVIAIKFFFLF